MPQSRTFNPRLMCLLQMPTPLLPAGGYAPPKQSGYGTSNGLDWLNAGHNQEVLKNGYSLYHKQFTINL
jgi:hypothetical protein